MKSDELLENHRLMLEINSKRKRKHKKLEKTIKAKEV
jgi:hypothetical protein